MIIYMLWDQQTCRHFNTMTRTSQRAGPSENIENKFTHVFLRVFVTKHKSRIGVFLASKPRRHHKTISDKIRKLLLSPSYEDWQK